MEIDRSIREKRLPAMLADFPPVRSAGLNLHFSGIGCRNSETGKCVGVLKTDARGNVSKYDFREQFHGAFRNLITSLTAFDLGLESLVSVKVMLINKEDWDALNDLWNDKFSDVPLGRRPVRTVGFYSGLPIENMIELDSMARLSIFQFVRLALQRRLP